LGQQIGSLEVFVLRLLFLLKLVDSILQSLSLLTELFTTRDDLFLHIFERIVTLASLLCQRKDHYLVSDAFYSQSEFLSTALLDRLHSCQQLLLDLVQGLSGFLVHLTFLLQRQFELANLRLKFSSVVFDVFFTID
jgi:hypothetical protein